MILQSNSRIDESVHNCVEVPFWQELRHLFQPLEQHVSGRHFDKNAKIQVEMCLGYWS
jgi:hypothetical protein